MKDVTKKYYHIKGTKKASEAAEFEKGLNNYVVVELFYDEGGYSMLGGNCSRRGYYISARKIDKGKHTEIVALFGSGKKYLIQEVSRQSKKKESEALEWFNTHEKEFALQVFPSLELEEESVA